eukprot:10233429-Alexandrium_andersonii.AAC.1
MATGSQHGAHAQLAARKAPRRRRSMNSPGVVSCAAYGTQDATEVFRWPARVAADWRAAPMATARS